MTETANLDSSIQDRVTAICNELYAEGTKPSVRRVLSMLPDVSSTSTVHKYYANWKKELEANQQSLYDRLGFSSEFTQSFMKEITRFGVEAEQRYKEQSQDANDQRDQALEDLEKSEDKLYKQTAVLQQLEKEISELQSELVRVKSDSKTEMEKQHTLAATNLEKERESHAAIVQELRIQLNDALEANKALTESNETIRTEAAKANLKLEGNEAYVNEVKEQNKALTTDNKALNAEIAHLNKTLAGQEATIHGDDKLIQSLQQQLVKHEQLSDDAAEKNTKLNNELDSARNDINALTNKFGEAMDRLSKEVEKNTRQKHSFDEKIRAHEQTEKSNAATIAGNEKLIAQLEKASEKSEAEVLSLQQSVSEMTRQLKLIHKSKE
ncbi:DNA-binding protein [Vibrio nigripulchritudo]|uniref:DNA-binding protein n=1 Tax=Vibrio nigripulchritudo TaxID=28173 RepID=UPI0003B23BE0|nr:DNA-binding protein [Vibrio nigripulchritudo]CCN86015.1 putative Mfp1 (Mar binding filament-like protein 1) [Vibrio nigripulchritudo BLFn1]CCN97813.1 putative Mfp1 (Mar binding filament-like protein 1) [Vibrio nigripulchritudo ENn2]CCO56124.1 putative Mfp1 (Mar binding filament-like protein 1) [Vibrio nigripulchritudo Wn13]